MGVCPLLAHALTTTTPSSVYPISYSLSFHTFAHSFALFCIFLHASNMQLFSFQAIPHSLAKTPGVGYESVWVLGFCSSRPQHIVREWLAAHNLWPRLVVATQTRTPPITCMNLKTKGLQNEPT